MTSLPKRVAQEAVRISWTSLSKLFFGPEVIDPPDWKKLGGVILAPNHCSYLDPVMLQAAIPKHIRFMMTEGIYNIRSMKWFFDLFETIPVPDGDAVKVGAMKEALRAVRGGATLGIFPEGGISRNGLLQPGQPGVVALMMRARVPVIPVAILGTYRLLPRHANFFRAARVTVRFGQPLDPPPEELARDGVRAYAQRIMDAIHALGAPRSVGR
jgi:1-acyl-sn-glycerol-3-phosphate acyltransferase